MPTYVYECSKCSKVFEVEQRIIEDPLKDCECGGRNTVKRLIQPTAVMFKGGGFHINDYSGSAAAPSPSDKTPDATKETKTSPPAASTDGTE